MKKTRELHDALLRMVGFLNRPQADAVLMKEAGISLDRALFPLLVRVERAGSIGVVGLADLVGRDYTTVSRQTAKLEAVGLIAKKTDKSDRRVSQLVATAKGRRVTGALDAARERLVAPVLAQWSDQDVKHFIRLLGKFVDDAEQRIEDAQRSA